MKSILMIFSLVILRCCWGPTDFQLMMEMQNDGTVLKELNDTYKIKVLNGEDVSFYNLSITFNDSTKKVSGFSGCNHFFGSYSLNNHVLKFGDLGVTKMLCNDETNDIETTLFKAFKKAHLILFTKDGFSFYNKKRLLLSATKADENQFMSFEYFASSRGSYKKIIINKKTISAQLKRDGKPTIKACNTANWDAIINALKTIDIEHISALESPSKAFQYDGAALARLKISYDGHIYETQAFDHGNPHENIAGLVKEILSMSENME